MMRSKNKADYTALASIAQVEEDDTNTFTEIESIKDAVLSMNDPKFYLKYFN